MIRYMVRSGDTLSAIADRFGTTVRAIMAANNLTNPDVIFAGQILLIPVEPHEHHHMPPEYDPDHDEHHHMPPKYDPDYHEHHPMPPGPPPRPPRPRPRPTVVRTFDGVEYTLSLNRSVYRMGDPITIRLRKRNILSVPLNLTYRTSQKVDFRVTRDNRLIWQWSRKQFFTQMVITDTLQPGEEKVYRVVWNQRTDDMLVRPGIYRLTGWNLATPSIRLSLEFEIVR